MADKNDGSRLRGFFIWRSVTRKPVPTNASYELAIVTMEKATEELAEAKASFIRERIAMGRIMHEMSSTLLMTSPYKDVPLTPAEELDDRVEADLKRRREQI